MTIPDFQTLMLPFLRSLKNGSECSTQETLDALAPIGLGAIAPDWLSGASITHHTDCCPRPSRRARR